MKKRIAFFMFAGAVFCTALFLFSSCEMFTTSLAKGAVRSQRDVLKKASASELLAFSRGAYASDPKTLAEVLNLLSEKRDEIKKLSLKEKEQILGLTLETGFPVGSIKKVADEALQAFSGDTSAQGVKKLVDKMMDAVNPVNTGAAAQLLSDPVVMRKADPAALANAAVAVFAQSCAGIYDRMEKVDFDKPTEQIVGKIVNTPGADLEKQREALKAAVETIKLLSGKEARDCEGKPVKRSVKPADVKFLGFIALKDLLKEFEDQK